MLKFLLHNLLKIMMNLNTIFSMDNYDDNANTKALKIMQTSSLISMNKLC